MTPKSHVVSDSLHGKSAASLIASGATCDGKVVFCTVLLLQLMNFAKRLHLNLIKLWEMVLSLTAVYFWGEVLLLAHVLYTIWNECIVRIDC